jgi:glycosyltransferase involved in cell wall biosynthesis
MDISNLTIIIPTRNEAHNISALLNSIPATVEVILIDASSDDTAAIAKNIRPGHTRVIFSSARIAEARQLGANAATTTWLLFSDADVIFPPDYFPRLRDFWPGAAIYGPKLSQGPFKTYYRLFAWGQQLSHGLGIPAVSGSNFLVQKHALEKAGGFDLDLVCNEDSELGWRIKRHGYRLTFAAGLSVYARDHRRLQLGVTRKTLHSVVRCIFLYFNLIPKKWRSRDWGYWSTHQEYSWSSENSSGAG